MKKIHIYLIVLLLLIVAWYFRWDYGVIKETDYSVLKWKTDRWTGQIWVEQYLIERWGNPTEIKTYAIKPYTTKKPYYYRNIATRAWQISILIAGQRQSKK